MNVSYKIALRYLFSKKSHSAINIVSLISVCGVAVGTMALVCVLSVFNGFQGVISGLFSNFDPQVRVVASSGKCFEPDSIQSILSSPDIECYSYVIEDNALLQFKDKQVPVNVKGVDLNYDTLTDISSILESGEFLLKSGNFNQCVSGAALSASVGSGVYLYEPMHLYAPKREGNISIARPDKSFREELVYQSGTFMVKQEKYDNSLIIVPIEVARSLFAYETEVTSVDMKLKNGVDEDAFIEECTSKLGDGYEVQNRYEQQMELYRMMKVEKWITYLILSFILLIAIFNIIGSLSMLIIEKKDDMAVLSNIGMKRSDVRKVFICEGVLISVIGVLTGIILGLVLCWLQIRFGFISMGEGSYIVNSYPVDVRFGDIIIVALTVMVLGFAASIYPARHAVK